jgi:hypothetical protein
MRAVMKDRTVAEGLKTARDFAVRRNGGGAGVKTVMLGIFVVW